MVETFPLVDILILNWNGIEDTLACLKSLRAVDYPNFKVWVLDNGSREDNSRQILNNLSKKGEIRFVDNKINEGYDVPCNRLILKVIKENKEGYILLLNNDATVEPNFLKELLAEIVKDKKIGVVGPAVYHKKHRLSWDDYPGYFNFLIGGSARELNVKTRIHKKLPFEVGYLSGSCWLIKKGVLSETGLFEERYFAYYEEIELAYRIRQKGYRFVLVPSSKIYHEAHSSSKKLTGFQLYYQNRNLLWFEKRYASWTSYMLYLAYLFVYKIPKTMVVCFSQRDNAKDQLKRYFESIYDGLRGIGNTKRIGFYKL